MKYCKDEKCYEVEEVVEDGLFVNVNGTTITDLTKQAHLFNLPPKKDAGFSVFVGGDELYFKTFDAAFKYAMTKQKDTHSI